MTSSRLLGLRGLGLKTHYRSDEEDLIQELYIPALSVATEYRRAVGYFTSASLEAVATGLDSFIDRGGTIQLVASPRLDAEDVADIERGYQLRAVFERAAMRELMDSDTYADPTPLSRHGEIHAALTGRRIYRLDVDLRLWATDRWRITTDPLPGDHLLAEHVCGQPIPSNWIAPEPPTPATRTEEPMF